MAVSKSKASEEVVVEPVNAEVTPEVPATPAKKVRKQVDINQLVSCKNVTIGTLTYVSKKTGLEVNWNAYGDEEYLEVSELLTMRGSQPRFLNEPWVMIEDEDVIEYLGLKDLYTKMFELDQIDKLFSKQIPEIENILATAPRGMKELVVDKAREMVANETLYDVRIIKLIEKYCTADLTMVQE